MSEGKMDMVRMPRQEQLLEREQVFGRDAGSVFPTRAKEEAAEAVESVKARLGGNRFITETEVEELRSQKGDEAEAPLKPLTQVLFEAKEAKEAAFQAQWRQMKQGKNRPLDDEELEFIDAVMSRQRDKEQAEQVEDSQQLEAFQEAVRLAAEAKASRLASSSNAEASQRPKQYVQGRQAKPAAIRPLIQIKRAPPTLSATTESKRPAQASKAEQAPAKKAKAVLPAPHAPGGLLGIDYGSESDSGG